MEPFSGPLGKFFQEFHDLLGEKARDEPLKGAGVEGMEEGEGDHGCDAVFRVSGLEAVTEGYLMTLDREVAGKKREFRGTWRIFQEFVGMDAEIRGVFSPFHGTEKGAFVKDRC